jgi:hypothetical protein
LAPDGAEPLDSNRASAFECEREILQAILAPNASINSLPQIKEALHNYPWVNTDHRTIFEALSRLPANIPSSEVRTQLAAQTTRMGFPDVNWDLYFVAAKPEIPLTKLIEKLLASR